MSGLVTIIQPMGFVLGVMATSVALARTQRPMRVFAPKLRPVPVPVKRNPEGQRPRR